MNKAVLIGIIAAIILGIALVSLSNEFGLEESAPEEIKGDAITVELSESIGLTGP